MTFTETLKSYKEHLTIDRNLNPRTIESYRIDLLQLIEFLQSNEVLIPVWIDKRIVRQYYQWLCEKYSVRTIKRKIAAAKGYFKFLKYEGLLKVNPFDTMGFRLPEPKELPEILSVQEVKLFLDHLNREREKVKKKTGVIYREKLRDLIVLEFLFATGARASELCTILPSDIDFTTGTILIRGKRNKQRLVHIFNEETLNLMKEYYDLFERAIETTGKFFLNRQGSEMRYSSIRYLITKTASQLGFHRLITPHTFRHTFATLLLEEEVGLRYIQHFLEHSSMRTTAIYTHVTKKKQREILMEKHPRKEFSLVRK